MPTAPDLALVPACRARATRSAIAFLIYRGNPHCGGQGVYSRHLTRELTELGHDGDDVRGPAVAGRRRRR